MARRLDSLALKIEAPTGQPVPGRGFYQLEEDALYVPVGHKPNGSGFFSYLESDRVRFDVDLTGRLMLIEVDFPRRRWEVDDNLAAPSIAEPADIRWLDFRSRIPEPRLITNPRRTELMLQFAPGESWRWYTLARGILVQVTSDFHLAAVFITEVEDDLAGRRIATFRKEIRARRAEIETGLTSVDSISG